MPLRLLVLALLLLGCEPDPPPEPLPTPDPVVPADTSAVSRVPVNSEETAGAVVPGLLAEGDETWDGFYETSIQGDVRVPDGPFVFTSTREVDNGPLRVTYEGRYDMGEPVGPLTALLEAPEGDTRYALVYDAGGACIEGRVEQEAEGMRAEETIEAPEPCTFEHLRDVLYGQEE